MSEYRIVLASASPRRIALLHQIGIDAEVLPSHKPEKITSSDPEIVVRELSLQKAEDIAEQLMNSHSQGIIHPDPADESFFHASDRLIVIGADTVVAIDGKILGKPKTHEEAFSMISEISGRAHHVFTGVTVLSDKGAESFVESTTVHVAPMTEGEIRSYADSGEPMDKAGAYGIQGFFGRYISGIEGDYNNVVGLPAAHLYQVLKRITGGRI